MAQAPRGPIAGRNECLDEMHSLVLVASHLATRRVLSDHIMNLRRSLVFWARTEEERAELNRQIAASVMVLARHERSRPAAMDNEPPHACPGMPVYSQGFMARECVVEHIDADMYDGGDEDGLSSDEESEEASVTLGSDTTTGKTDDDEVKYIAGTPYTDSSSCQSASEDESSEESAVVN